jgi:hypothetical protein
LLDALALNGFERFDEVLAKALGNGDRISRLA